MNYPLSKDIFKKLLSLDLPKDDFAVFGSAPMWINNLKELGEDIDVIARGVAWDKASSLGSVTKSTNGGNVIRLFGEEIEIFDTWAPGEWDTNELIDSAVEIDGIRFVSLQNVLKWKEIYGRAKDLVHAELIRKYLATK